MRTIVPINEGWNFEKQGETSRVDLPHCWNAVDGQEGADYYVMALIQTFLGSRKMPSILFTIVKPFRVRTLLKLVKLDDGMKEIANQYLQTIRK